jgi:hypothetical protein
MSNTQLHFEEVALKTVYRSEVLSGILDSELRDFTITQIKNIEMNAVWEEQEIYSVWDYVTEALQNDQVLVFMTDNAEHPLLFNKDETISLYYELDEILSRLEMSQTNDVNKNRLN